MDKGRGLVAGQLAALAVIAAPGRPRWRLPVMVRAVAVAGMAAGAVVGADGARALGRELRALPEPSERAVLRTDGAYRWVRHPIYTGMLVGAGSLAVLRRRAAPLAALAALAGVLHVKAGYEEVLLRERFGAAYDDYASRTPRLLPGRRR